MLRSPLALLLLLLLVASARACPGCKEALAAQSGGGDLAAGFYYSILFMLCVPFTVLGGGVFAAYWSRKRALAAGDGHPADCTPCFGSATTPFPELQ